MKPWIEKAIKHLDASLKPVPHELNELDWKEDLSPKKDRLSEHLCAFANHPGGGFLAFGIENKTAKIVGITKEQSDHIIAQLGNLCRESVEPVVKMDHAIVEYLSVPILLIWLQESATKPVHLRKKTIEDTFIRSGGTTRRADRSEVGGLMLNSKPPVYEELHATNMKSRVEVLSQLEFGTIFKLLKKPVPSSEEEVLRWMVEEKMVKQQEENGFFITNFGALAAAQNLGDFDQLSRKAIRLIKYEGKTKTGLSEEFSGSKGYAIGFEGLIGFIKGLLPGSEIIKSALRQETRVYPEIALRELIANALIHQDFKVRGSGPMIEIFEDRVEITNPGKLLPSKQIDRLIRTTPESRNEVLAQAFRRYNICEERGSGFEKTVKAIELYGLPPLKFQETESSFKAILYAPRGFAEMSPEERLEAVYQHSVIRYYSGEGVTNASLRERFKMSEKQRPQISKLIREAVDAGKIKSKDESTSDKYSSYLPYWA